jgi:hypothetical protein
MDIDCAGPFAATVGLLNGIAADAQSHTDATEFEAAE